MAGNTKGRGIGEQPRGCPPPNRNTRKEAGPLASRFRSVAEYVREGGKRTASFPTERFKKGGRPNLNRELKE